MNKLEGKLKKIDELVAAYQAIISRPSISSARISSNFSGNQLVSAKWSQRSLERNQSVAFQAMYQISKGAVVKLGMNDVTSELLSQYSETESFKCIVRSVQDKTKKQFLEIWGEDRLLKNVDLSALDRHGDICSTGDFNSLEWSRDEENIVYIAEKKRIKAEPFFSAKPRTLPDDGSFPYGEEYKWINDWGEQMNGISQPVVVVYNLKDGLKILDAIPDIYSPAQVIWDETGSGFYGIVYENEPRRLGIIYCTNRIGYVFHLSMDQKFTLLSKPGFSPRCVRLSPDRKTLIWLERSAGGPHNACQALIKMDVESKQTETLIPIVDESISISNGIFHGLYSTLQLRCFSSDGKFIFFDSLSCHSCEVFSVALENGEITRLEEGRFLDAFDNMILIAKSNPIVYPFLRLITFDGAVTATTDVTAEKTATENVEVFARIVHGSDNGKFNSLFLKPSNQDTMLPLIVFPHGGPHSANFSTFMLEAAFFTQLGFAVLFINYRGSLGQGESSVHSLLGKIGTQDVSDVQLAVEAILNEFPDIDKEKIIAYGGSHGGFLSLHLAGQYPEIYKSVVVRNPVVDLSSMFVTSDIPDWIQTEIGSNYDPCELPSSQDLQKMVEMSPIRFIGNYKTPTLFLTGKNDLRVPMIQSLYYYRLLKARGIKTELFAYPDDHSLGTVPVHIDALIHSTFWIYDSLGMEI